MTMIYVYRNKKDHKDDCEMASVDVYGDDDKAEKAAFVIAHAITKAFPKSVVELEALKRKRVK